MTDDLPLICDTHGEMTWEGHVICNVCGRIFRPDAKPEFCRCGVRLYPDPADSSAEFSARAVCPTCYHQRTGPDLLPHPLPPPVLDNPREAHPALSGPHKVPEIASKEFT